jgi:predicted dinucleotide-binding enzyme
VVALSSAGLATSFTHKGMAMKIAIIGAGNVGGTLGRAWAKAGHEVMFGVRDPSSPKVAALLETTGGRAIAGCVAEAAAYGAVVALCTPWDVTESAVRDSRELEGKILLDCTNPLENDLSGLTVGRTTSGAELVAKWAPGARVVKAFNSTGFENMADPDFGGRATTMFIAGDDESAKAIACELAREIGFDPVVAGPLAMARLLEPLALLWIKLAVVQGYGTRIAFQLLRK